MKKEGVNVSLDWRGRLQFSCDCARVPPICRAHTERVLQIIHDIILREDK